MKNLTLFALLLMTITLSAQADRVVTTDENHQIVFRLIDDKTGGCKDTTILEGEEMPFTGTHITRYQNTTTKIEKYLNGLYVDTTITYSGDGLHIEKMNIYKDGEEVLQLEYDFVDDSSGKPISFLKQVTPFDQCKMHGDVILYNYLGDKRAIIKYNHGEQIGDAWYAEITK